MKSQRSLLLSLSFLLAVAAPLTRAADDTRPPGPPAGERRERMEKGGERLAEALGLSEDQKAKMKTINQAERAEMEALRDSATGDRETMRPKVQAIREKYKAQRDAILTPEQRTKAEKMRERMQDRVGDRRERMGEGGPGGERMKERREKKGAN